MSIFLDVEGGPSSGGFQFYESITVWSMMFTEAQFLKNNE